jgi:hypothetical protein
MLRVHSLTLEGFLDTAHKLEPKGKSKPKCFKITYDGKEIYLGEYTGTSFGFCTKKGESYVCRGMTYKNENKQEYTNIYNFEDGDKKSQLIVFRQHKGGHRNIEYTGIKISTGDKEITLPNRFDNVRDENIIKVEYTLCDNKGALVADAVSGSAAASGAAARSATSAGKHGNTEGGGRKQKQTRKKRGITNKSRRAR